MDTSIAQQFVDACNTSVVAIVVAGRRPIYKSFGFDVGAKYARIWRCVSGTDKSAAAFIALDGQDRGMVYRSDSWKKRGRLIGYCDAQEVLDYVVAPNCATSN